MRECTRNIDKCKATDVVHCLVRCHGLVYVCHLYRAQSTTFDRTRVRGAVTMEPQNPEIYFNKLGYQEQEPPFPTLYSNSLCASG